MHMDVPVVRNVVLIDYENVQPPSLKALLAPGFTVLVFVGASQPKISIEVAEAIQMLGPNGRYVRCNGKGPNALDFHIAFYIGEMSATDPGAQFRIVSNDTGFDPLVAHLQGRGLKVMRTAAVVEPPALPAAPPAPAKTPVNVAVKAAPAVKPVEARLAHLRACLVKQGKARPGSPTSLRRMIMSSFQNSLVEADVNALINQLKQQQWLVVEGNKVRYQLPAATS